mmetsp:Transcript_12951/g.22847  ORF Transcript_12951/g.22847 Transcript_12951/m.22847 type:complete len:160 (-) Transcript_12951:2750-3229(-)
MKAHMLEDRIDSDTGLHHNYPQQQQPTQHMDDDMRKLLTDKKANIIAVPLANADTPFHATSKLQNTPLQIRRSPHQIKPQSLALHSPSLSSHFLPLLSLFVASLSSPLTSLTLFLSSTCPYACNQASALHTLNAPLPLSMLHFITIAHPQVLDHQVAIP